MKTPAKPKSPSANLHSDSIPTIEPMFLTESQAAAAIGETTHQMYLHRRAGTGPPFVHGVRIRYPVDALREWAQALPRFTSRAEAYAKYPERADAAARQGGGMVEARKTRWPKRAGR